MARLQQLNGALPAGVPEVWCHDEVQALLSQGAFSGFFEGTFDATAFEGAAAVLPQPSAVPAHAEPAAAAPTAPAAVASAAKAAVPNDDLPVARLLHQGGDAVAARALTHRIARSVGVNKVVSAEASTQTAGSALLYVNWDSSNAHAVCAAVASELLAE